MGEVNVNVGVSIGGGTLLYSIIAFAIGYAAYGTIRGGFTVLIYAWIGGIVVLALSVVLPVLGAVLYWLYVKDWILGWILSATGLVWNPLLIVTDIITGFIAVVGTIVGIFLLQMLAEWLS